MVEEVIREKKQEKDLLMGPDTILNIAFSSAVTYAIFNQAVSISSYKGGAAISNALKAIGPAGVKGGVATLISAAVTVYAGMQMIQSYVGGKVLEADYTKGEKTKEEIIEHINRLPVSNTLQGSPIKKVRKFS
jgi:hypothetical protein